MRTNDINVGEHYAYTEYQSDRNRLIWAKEVEVLEVALDTKGPRGSLTVHVRFIGSAIPEAWVRPATIACSWEEAKARLAAKQRDREIEKVARDAARAAEEQARKDATNRFSLREMDTTWWVITFDTDPSVSATIEVATLRRSFFDEHRANRVLSDLRERFVNEAREKARSETWRRLEAPSASASMAQGHEIGID